MTTIFIVATETSGDIHGANLARQLKAIDPHIRLVGAGGPNMKAAGVKVTAETRTVGPIKFAFIEGPDQVSIELIEDKTQPPAKLPN